jgi:hypothetical protein
MSPSPGEMSPGTRLALGSGAAGLEPRIGPKGPHRTRGRGRFIGAELLPRCRRATNRAPPVPVIADLGWPSARCAGAERGDIADVLGLEDAGVLL